MLAVKIIDTPLGEAPVWVRRAWRGCVLPYSDTIGQAKGVISGKEGFGGYVVPYWTAIAVLISHRRNKAAQWWNDFYRERGFPDNFVFNIRDCEVI